MSSMLMKFMHHARPVLRSYSPATPSSKNFLQVTAQRRGLQGLILGVPKEIADGEHRVAIIPDDVKKLKKAGATILIQREAGFSSGWLDHDYTAAGASVVDLNEVWKAQVVAKVLPPSLEEAKLLENRTIVSIIQPRVRADLMQQFVNQGATVLAMDALLRTLSRGQAYDVLSSQAKIAGDRAVLEAMHHFHRPLAGQTTAAMNVRPAKVLVVGTGVAGLAAIQQAKKMGAIVYGFDVRSAAKEQVESCGAKFLAPTFSEDGSGAGGYAKEMSPEWFKAAENMLLDEVKAIDIIITTALIPGRPAPRLITKAMVEAMPRGGVIVDLAAPAGGNVETTVPGKVIKHGSITCVGYTNMESRMAETASKAFSGNVKNLLLSMEDKDTKAWKIDLNDPAVRSMLVVKDGESLPPYVPPPPSAEQLKQQELLKQRDEELQKKKMPKPESEIRSDYLKRAMFASAGTASALGIAALVPNSSMMTTFALSCWVGNSCVQGVAHSLHSPLMAMTNAISGMTIVGGMLQLGDGLVPTTIPEFLAATAVGLSAINLAGGTLVTKKMLDMFRRPTDPPEYNEYFLFPAAAAVIGSGALVTTGALAVSQVAPALALGSALGCVGGISCLASQETARLGISVGAGGIAAGLVSTLMYMQPAGMETYLQLAMLAAGGGAVGGFLSKRIGPTELPQAVAAFHSLVGLAATATAVGDFMSISNAADAATHHSNTFHDVSTYLGAWMGSITATGSAIAYGKLAGSLDSAPLQLAQRDAINIGLGGVSAASMLAFCASSDPVVSSVALGAGVVSSGALGLHMTQSIGGADMPVVITLLNSYSGWALCAEGFLLDQPLLTVVGALIGSSGAFLTKVMCEAMNRSLVSVILGGFGTAAPVKVVDASEVKIHKEIDVPGTAETLWNAEKILFVPGYGLAVAQAEKVVADIASLLRSHGKTVKFGVHGVAGRMPGQLNVILGDAGVPYDTVFATEEINEEMDSFDVCVIIGANDTVNSSALEDPSSAIAGMPVIEVWKAKQTIFMKRSMAAGYAGVDNPVFYKPNNDMLLGDAKKTCDAIRAALSTYTEK